MTWNAEVHTLVQAVHITMWKPWFRPSGLNHSIERGIGTYVAACGEQFARKDVDELIMRILRDHHRNLPCSSIRPPERIVSSTTHDLFALSFLMTPASSTQSRLLAELSREFDDLTHVEHAAIVSSQAAKALDGIAEVFTPAVDKARSFLLKAAGRCATPTDVCGSSVHALIVWLVECQLYVNHDDRAH
jgi:hypothetical protein